MVLFKGPTLLERLKEKPSSHDWSTLSLQIVLNHLLEEQLVEDRLNKKDKAGNGLKCKNRTKYQPKTNPEDDMAKQQDDSGPGDLDPKPGSSKGGQPAAAQLDFSGLVTDFTSAASRQNKRKLPPPTATVTSEAQVRISLLVKLSPREKSFKPYAY